jgi:cystathionine beta-lyase/cystathionine gamma-synthase
MKGKDIKSTRVPVYRDSGFLLNDSEEMRNAFLLEGKNIRDPENYIYSRYRNPTVVAAEEEIMKTEGCNWALLTQSGMAAVDVAVSLFQTAGSTRPWLFFTDIYGGTLSYIDSVLIARRGVRVEKFAAADQKYDLESLEAALSKIKPGFVYFEIISNPMLIVADGEKIINMCKKHGVKTIVDNTFATPWLWKPLEHGADLVIHSATKYFSGHGNLTAGVVCGNDDDLLGDAVAYRKNVGHMISADDAYRLHTQIQTFTLRFAHQCDNAMRLAEYLSQQSIVEKVWYPGLVTHSTHEEAARQFNNKGFGAMLTFTFKGSDTERSLRRDAFIKAASGKIKLVPTLGDPHTILMPVEPVWGDRYPDPGMLRISVGFEPWDQLLMNVKEAMPVPE